MIREAIRRVWHERVQRARRARSRPVELAPWHARNRRFSRDLDMSRSVDRRRLSRGSSRSDQGRLNLLHRKARDKGITTILVFEGWDAAGKGGAIRRVTAALDAPSYAGDSDRRADR